MAYKDIKLKPLKWVKEGAIYRAQIMGAELTAYPNEHRKYTARISVPNKRPEMETSLDDANEAMRYAENILLPRELSFYFTGF